MNTLKYKAKKTNKTKQILIAFSYVTISNFYRFLAKFLSIIWKIQVTMKINPIFVSYLIIRCEIMQINLTFFTFFLNFVSLKDIDIEFCSLLYEARVLNEYTIIVRTLSEIWNDSSAENISWFGEKSVIILCS